MSLQQEPEPVRAPVEALEQGQALVVAQGLARVPVLVRAAARHVWVALFL